MADIVAKRVTSRMPDLGLEPPECEQTADGYRGRDHWYVNTAVLGDAWGALGLPDMGSIFQDAPPGVDGFELVNRKAKVHSGEPSATAGQSGGTTVFEMFYATPGNTPGGSIPQPNENVKYTEWGYASASVQRTSSGQVDPNLVGPPEPPWNNGRGVSVEVGWLSLRVVGYKTPAAFTNQLARVTELITLRAVNSDAITLPSILGTVAPGSGLSFLPGQLRYGGCEVEQTGNQNLWKVTHVLEAAADWKARWQSEDENGQPVGSVVVKDAYPARAFAGL